MRSTPWTVVYWLVAASVLLVGCRHATDEEPAEQQTAEPQDNSGSGSREPDNTLSELIGSGKRPDNGIPPAKLVDVRDLTEKFDDGTVRVARKVKYFSDGSTVNHGAYTEWYDEGEKFMEGSYEDGKRVGLWTFYREDGRKAKAGGYKDNLPDGTWTYWAADGSKQREENYRDGRKDGTWTTWYSNGQKQSELHFADGQQDGEQFFWYESGKPARQVHMSQGKLDGKDISWNEQGVKTAERVFRDGVLVDRVSSNQ
jgi:antitoxin component YwqK of YwqJK toxin-antitoxin module